jgi:hypothetical protein
MCEPSIVADDWITKGCHIYVGGIELAVFPDHRGHIGFRPVFSSDSNAKGAAAVKLAHEQCLSDSKVRMRWISHLEGARIQMLACTSILSDLARGRMAEFNFLRVALERWQNDNA